jgi:8-oxo-dGTP pyrophosphatase MutT (NUDIX family)/sugar/nucleoside kinase (ribokinase family)
MYVRPAGSAYNAAVGTLAVSGEGIFIASSSPSFNRTYLDKFNKTRVRILDKVTHAGPEHIFLFDLRNLPHSKNLISLGSPHIPPIECLEQHPFQGIHVHLGTMDPAELMEVQNAVCRLKPSATFSCNLYEPYLIEGSRQVMEVINACSILFMNYAGFMVLREQGQLRTALSNKIALVTCEDFGSVCFVDEVPVYAYTPDVAETKCAIGAGDVFAGAFLGAFLAGNDVSHSLIVATDAAVASVSDYGVEAVLKNRTKMQPRDVNVTRGIPRFKLSPPSDFTLDTVTYEIVVEATGLFIIRDDKLLLVNKPDDKAFRPGVYYVPGGKIEPNESPEACARRELAEETGIRSGEFDLLGVSYYAPPTATRKLYRFYEFMVKNTIGEPVANDDVSSCVWYPINEIKRDDLFEMAWAQVWLLRHSRS